MQKTMLRNESLNNEGALSCSHHDLHLKAHRHIHRKSRQAYSSANSNFHQAPQQSVTETNARSQTHTLLIDYHSCFLHFDGIAATTPVFLHHPTQKSLDREQLRESTP